MERKKHNSGIALVMVLGVLSVMVIMAVAFAISMRTERVAAGNYADSVRARQLVHVGIARALDDLAGKLGTNGLMSAAGGTNYTPWTVANSYTTNYVNTSTNKLFLLTGKATDFVPRALWAAAMNADQFGAANHWLPLDSLIYANDTNGVSQLVESNRMGRVKYLILNCSGLLDAHLVGGATRGVGVSPAELAIINMPEIQSSAALFNNRANLYRYETLEEFRELNKNAFYDYPSNFVVNSYNRMGYWDAVAKCVATQVNLSGTSEELKLRQGAIMNAFVQAGYLPAEAGILYANLIDYADMDAIPGNLQTCVENVPMINEVVFSNNVIALPLGNIAINNSVFVELWTPFIVSNQSEYQFEVQVNYDSTFINGSNSTPTPINQTRAFSSFSGSFTTLMFSVSQAPVTNLGIPIVCTSVVSIARVSALPSGARVDELLSDGMGSISTNPVGGYTKKVYECRDPRLNWDPNNIAKWCWQSNNVDSLGQKNSIISGLNDSDTAMYVDTSEPADIAGNDVLVSGLKYYRTGTPVVFDSLLKTNYIYYTIMPDSSQINKIFKLADTYDKAMRNEPKPFLVPGSTRIKSVIQSVGELGYLHYAPWQTVELYGSTMKKAVNTFAVCPQTTFKVDHVLGGLEKNTTITISNSTVVGAIISFREGLPVTVSSSDTLPNAQPLPLVANKIYYTTNCVSDVQLELFDPSANSIVGFLNFGLGTHVISPTYILPESSRRGMVNMNALNDVMHTVFENIIMEPYPNTPEEVFTVSAGNILKVSGNRRYFTGNPVQVFSAINVFPSGLSGETTYYTIPISASEIQLADSYEHAVIKQPILVVGGGGGGVLTIRSSTLSFDDVSTIAQNIINNQIYTNVSEIGKASVNLNPSSMTISSKMIKESILRNSIGLFNVRQNLFTIIIEADVASGGNIPRNPVRQRAVVIVWRDPYTGEMFKRNISWLGD